jgi:hypothetical protein
LQHDVLVRISLGLFAAKRSRKIFDEILCHD